MYGAVVLLGNKGLTCSVHVRLICRRDTFDIYIYIYIYAYIPIKIMYVKYISVKTHMVKSTFLSVQHIAAQIIR